MVPFSSVLLGVIVRSMFRLGAAFAWYTDLALAFDANNSVSVTARATMIRGGFGPNRGTAKIQRQARLKQVNVEHCVMADILTFQ